MIETTLENARKYGMFVHEIRCPCPDNELKATNFTKVRYKYTNEGRRKFYCFMLAISIAFVPLSVFLIIHYYTNATKSLHLSHKETLFLWILALLLIAAIFALSLMLCCLKSYFECKQTSLEVLFNCDSCGHNVHKTYECFVHSSSRKNHTYYYNQTDNPWGRYTAQNVTKKVLQKPSATTNFERVERKFKLMSGD